MKDKIKELESLSARWKALCVKRSHNPEEAVTYEDGMVDGLETAIRILKEPSNTQIQVGTKLACKICKVDGPVDKFGNCFKCARALSD